MALSWNEIKDRAIIFAKTQESTANEESNAKSFLDAFFDIFGMDGKRHTAFEYYIKHKTNSEVARLEFLFELYEKYTANLFTKENSKTLKKNNKYPTIQLAIHPLKQTV